MGNTFYPEKNQGDCPHSLSLTYTKIILAQSLTFLFAERWIISILSKSL